MPEARVYKVVRQHSSGRLISAILPDHLATVYRTAKGNIRTVDDAMAFQYLSDAETFAYQWGSRQTPLQVWRATATIHGTPRLIVGWISNNIKYMGRQLISAATRTKLPKKNWLAAISELQELRQSGGAIRRDSIAQEGIDLVLTEPPPGSRLCSEFRLAEHVITCPW